ncbi:hypothetical protein PM082_004610 [Marasmius tenuissimus]|nr:hypothetical protein PM082_004610 [Marasmius tenuissimus]
MSRGISPIRRRWMSRLNLAASRRRYLRKPVNPGSWLVLLHALLGLDTVSGPARCFMQVSSRPPLSFSFIERAEVALPTPVLFSPLIHVTIPQNWLVLTFHAMHKHSFPRTPPSNHISPKFSEVVGENTEQADITATRERMSECKDMLSLQLLFTFKMVDGSLDWPPRVDFPPKDFSFNTFSRFQSFPRYSPDSRLDDEHYLASFSWPWSACLHTSLFQVAKPVVLGGFGCTNYS